MNRSLTEELDLDEHIIRNWIMETTDFSITRIKKLPTEHLKMEYKARRSEIRDLYPCWREIHLFHATGRHRVDNIVKNNLEKKYVTRGLYGIGVSFSDDASYCNRYANKHVSSQADEKVLIICQIIIGQLAVVRRNERRHPEAGIDTHKSMDGKVYVKFDKTEYCPMYAAYYRT